VRKLSSFIVSRVAAGLLVILPLYLAALLLFKAMQSLMELVQPLEKLLPEKLPGGRLLSLLLVLLVCFLMGLAVRTPAGRAAWKRIERSHFQRIPGYALFHSLTHRLAGEDQDKTWQPAFAEIEEALVPAFIIEELPDGSFTVFVPSVPTPLAGSVFILTPNRVHPLNVPFTEAIKAISRWGAGSKDLIAVMEKGKEP
jgi:uncharacterized membrane protein